MTAWSTRRKLTYKERRHAAAVGRRYNEAILRVQQSRNEINELIRTYDGVVTQEELALALDVDRNIIREAKLRLGLPKRQRRASGRTETEAHEKVRGKSRGA